MSTLEFKAGDDQPDIITPGGKKWLAKKDETLPELKKRSLDPYEDLAEQKTFLGGQNEPTKYK